MRLDDNQIFALWLAVITVFGILLIVAAFDVYSIWNLTKEYKELKATCPVYRGMVITEPENFTGNLYIEICNGSVIRAKERCFEPILGGYR